MIFIYVLRIKIGKSLYFVENILAHNDSVTCIRFLNKSHYFFSCSKDGTIKYWNGDNGDDNGGEKRDKPETVSRLYLLWGGPNQHQSGDVDLR